VTRPRTLTPTHITDLVADLRALADLLARPDAPTIIDRVTTAATIGYPRSGFAAGSSSGGNGDGSPLDATTDRIAGFSARILVELHQMRRDAPVLASALRGWMPDRPVAVDPRCGHPLAPGEQRCRLVDDDGTPCGTEAVVPLCADCPKPLAPGERRKGRCNACRVFLDRHGYTRASVGTYAAATAGIIVDGVGHA
jgi:hypothetical protein